MNNSNKVICDLLAVNDIDLYNKDSDNRNCFDYASAMGNDIFNYIIKMINTKSNQNKKLLYIIVLTLRLIIINNLM